MQHLRRLSLFVLLGALLLVIGCRQESASDAAPTPQPTATSVQGPTVTPASADPNYITVATDAPYPPFTAFDEFGTVIGFDAEIVETIMARTGYDYEFVVTSFDGMLDSVARDDFDMAVAAVSREEPVSGILYSNPYLEVGQVLVVLANESAIGSYHDVAPGVPIGVLRDSLAGQRAALEIVGVPENSLLYYDSVGEALLALRDGEVSGIIIDSDDAEHYTRTHYEQFKIAGGMTPDAWITHQEYVMAIDADRPELLEAVNAAIVEAEGDGTIERVKRNWLVSKETIDPGESLIGTPEEIIVIGVLGQLDAVDPASPPEAIGWEVKYNTMSGLYMFDEANNLAPMLASGPPQVSEDRLEYTFTLRSGLTFPDGTEFSADDVRFSVMRAAAFGNWHVNHFLKDDDGDFIADADAVQVLGPTSVKFVLKQPAPYFLNVLATPPYFIASEECYATDPEPARNCNSIGMYEIIEWAPGEPLQLRANPQWPGDSPAFANIHLRFYEDVARLRTAVDVGAVDVVWGDLPDQFVNELEALDGIRAWEGSPTFKSYLVFQQDDTPWQSPTVRQAAAYAVDREALARTVFNGRRDPLYSPLPTSVSEHLASEPERDLEQARELLLLAGYSELNPLVVPLWYLNDGRYTVLEEAYATAIKEQLEETGMIQVELNGASWDIYSVQMSSCNYATFLLGWPPVGWPTRYPAAMGWMEHFIAETDSLCSNYESISMNALLNELRLVDPTDTAAQRDIYTRMQQLWAQEYPTLDLTEGAPRAVATDTVGNVTFDLMGLLRYGALTKSSTPGG